MEKNVGDVKVGDILEGSRREYVVLSLNGMGNAFPIVGQNVMTRDLAKFGWDRVSESFVSSSGLGYTKQKPPPHVEYGWATLNSYGFPTFSGCSYADIQQAHKCFGRKESNNRAWFLVRIERPSCDSKTITSMEVIP